MTHPTICLFDIDGTLLTTGGAGRRAFEAAFAGEFGPGHGLLDFSFSGMTDRLLARRGLENADRPVTPEVVEALIETYLENLSETVARSTDYQVHPGVRQLLEELEDREAFAMGLGTGNVERGARIKLARGELNDYFAFGGFGSDAEDRAELLEAGIRRGADRLAPSLEECRLVVIGDTCRDIAAARAIGAEVVAVGTGSGSTMEQLRKAGPDLLVEDLTDRRLPQVLS